MQKPNLHDLGRVAGWTLGTAGILFAVGIAAKIPLVQLLTPTAIMFILVLGFAVSVMDLVIVLRNPERLAVARGEMMPSGKSVQQFQNGARRLAKLSLWAAVGACAVAIAAIAAFAVLQ